MIEEALAEGAPSPRIVEGDAKRLRHHPAAHGGDIGAGPIDAGERALERLARRIEQGIVIDADTDELDAARADGVPAHHRVRADALDARGLHFNEEGGNPRASRGG